MKITGGSVIMDERAEIFSGASRIIDNEKWKHSYHRDSRGVVIYTEPKLRNLVLTKYSDSIHCSNENIFGYLCKKIKNRLIHVVVLDSGLKDTFVFIMRCFWRFDNPAYVVLERTGTCIRITAMVKEEFTGVNKTNIKAVSLIKKIIEKAPEKAKEKTPQAEMTIHEFRNMSSYEIYIRRERWIKTNTWTGVGMALFAVIGTFVGSLAGHALFPEISILPIGLATATILATAGGIVTRKLTMWLFNKRNKEG
jgi:ElaB/YqjD/DUF883 family membrane-anchored ribosome-binding protein